MQKTIFIAAIAFITWHCGQNDKKVTEDRENAIISSENDLPSRKLNWADTMLVYYIKHTDNELIKLALTDTIPEEWLFQGAVDRDNTRYLLFNIGHDVEDEDGKRFVTDGWIYIDSVNRKLYEYDLPNDSLMEWKR